VAFPARTRLSRGCKRQVSPVSVDAQFQTTGRYISNLDRCNRCGRPRSAHGIDWTCSPARMTRGHNTALMALLAAMLALAGMALLATSNAISTTLDTFAVSASLVGLTLLAFALSVAIRWR
jgi:hypothetical protein